MSLVLTNPWGLLAFASIPAILLLHLFVLRGKRRQVSCLALWGAPDQLGHEGKTRQRPPITVPLILELCAAIALSLLLAGIEVIGAASSERVVGVVVDGSASMAGGTALAETREHIASLDPSLRVALFVTTPEPRRLGEPGMTPAAAVAALEAFTPSAPHHSLAPAVDLLARSGFAPEQTLIFSDAPDLDDERIARVGQPVANVGIVNASWESGVPIVALVQRFGAEPATAELRVAYDDGRHESVTVDFRHTSVKTVRVRPPPSTVARVTLSLPADNLAADNEVTLLRPGNRSVTLRLEHPAPGVRRAVRRAITAIPDLSMAPRDGDIVVTDGSARAATFAIEIAIVVPEKSELLSHYPIVAEPGSPLMRGIDPRGLVWSGDPNPTAGVPLLLAGKVPLVWLDDDRIVVQVDPRHSNLLSHATFPILFDNITDSLQHKRARARRSFRLGERLVIHRPTSCGGAALLRAPSGAELDLGTEEVLDAGALNELGVYEIQCDGRSLQRLAVSLLDAREGELAARTPDGIQPHVSARSRRAGGNVVEPRQVLAAAAGLLVLAAWLWLSRREVTP